MNRATVTFEYKSAEEAGIVARMLDVDNRVAPKTLKIETVNKDNKVVTTVEHEKPGTIFAPVDEFLFTERLVSGLVEVTK
jgi:hypothetical protein